MTQIKAIVVDYGGVLVEAPSDPENIARVAAKMGISPAQMHDGIFGKEKALWNRAKLGLISDAEYWAEVKQTLQLPTNEIDRLRHEFFEVVTVHQPFVDFLWGLRSSYKLAILSNAIPVFSKVWTALGFDNWFDVTINSSLVGVAKPDPKIYELVESRLSVPAQACIFVDDQAKNLTVASELGFHTIQYLESEQAIEAITKRLKTNNVE